MKLKRQQDRELISDVLSTLPKALRTSLMLMEIAAENELYPNTKTKKHHTRIIINRTPPHDPGVCERPWRKDGSPYAGVIQAALRIGIVKKISLAVLSISPGD